MSLALHAGVFAAGLAIGAAAVTASTSSTSSKASTSKLPPAQPTESQSNTNKLQNLVPRPDNGALQRFNNTTAVEVLKYGFPGMPPSFLSRCCTFYQVIACFANADPLYCFPFYSSIDNRTSL